MFQKIKIGGACLLVLFILCPAFASMSGLSVGGFSGTLPPPQLVSPTSDSVNLTGKDTLEFKWIGIDAVMVDHYEFKLYKGYQTLASTLILKAKVSRDEASFKVDSEKFSDTNVYTWVLKQISISGRKSDPGFSSFTIIKKAAQ